MARAPEPRRRARVAAAALLGAVISGAPALAGPAAEPAHHGPEFWRQIKASGFAVPAGESPLPLLLELSESLGSPDPEMRDGFGYDIPAAWIYRQKLLGADDLRVLLRRWSGNLRVGIGETGTDTVLFRSFSALDLSILAAHDLQAPFLSPAEFHALLGDALTYLKDERDVRGFTPPVGWRHSCAHTADLLKFLGRSPHLTAADGARVLEAVKEKITRVGDPVYVWGEDERMARALLSLVRRTDFDPAALDPWLADLAAIHAKAWEPAMPDPARLAADRNATNLLKSLATLLAQPTETAPAAAPVLSKVLAVLAKY